MHRSAAGGSTSCVKRSGRWYSRASCLNASRRSCQPKPEKKKETQKEESGSRGKETDEFIIKAETKGFQDKGWMGWDEMFSVVWIA
jgi:hypothetical protein